MWWNVTKYIYSSTVLGFTSEREISISYPIMYTCFDLIIKFFILVIWFFKCIL